MKNAKQTSIYFKLTRADKSLSVNTNKLLPNRYSIAC